MAAERVVWYLWADSLVLAIPNNSGQSDRCMVTCLPKSRGKLVGDESQAPFSSIFCRRRLVTRRLYSCIRGETFFVSLPTGAGKSLCFTVLPLLPVRLVEISGAISRRNGGRSTGKEALQRTETSLLLRIKLKITSRWSSVMKN